MPAIHGAWDSTYTGGASGWTFSNGDRTVVATSNGFIDATDTIAASTLIYFEILHGVAVGDIYLGNNQYQWSSTNLLSIEANGAISWNFGFICNIGTPVPGDVTQFCLDTVANKLWARRNNTGNWNNTSGDAPNGASVVSISGIGSPVYIHFNASGAGLQATLNATTADFVYSAPAGASPLYASGGGGTTTDDLAAAAASIATASATLRVQHHLAGSAADVASASAALDAKHHLAAAAQSLATATAGARVSHHLNAAAADIAAASAALDVLHTGQDDLSAAAQAAATASASLRVQHHLAAAAAAIATAVAQIDARRHLAAAAASIASATATLDLQHPMTASGVSLATATAVLDLKHHLAGTAAAIATASAALDVQATGGPKHLAGTAAAQASATAALDLQHHLAAAAAARAAATATIDVQRVLAAAAGVTVSASAALDIQHHLAAAAASIATASGLLFSPAAPAHLSASGAAQASAGASLRARVPTVPDAGFMERPFLDRVLKADPDYQRYAHGMTEYEFSSGRSFWRGDDDFGPYLPYLVDEYGEAILDEFGRTILEENGRRL